MVINGSGQGLNFQSCQRKTGALVFQERLKRLRGRKSPATRSMSRWSTNLFMVNWTANALWLYWTLLSECSDISDPELMLVYDALPHSYISLDGFPPWHIRLTEFVYVYGKGARTAIFWWLISFTEIGVHPIAWIIGPFLAPYYSTRRSSNDLADRISHSLTSTYRNQSHIEFALRFLFSRLFIQEQITSVFLLPSTLITFS